VAGGAGRVVALHHVQVAMPAGQEEIAERFYSGVLGFERVEKPEALRARGGCWFRSGAAECHLGVEADFRPARKAHPAFLVDDLAAIRARLERARVEVVPDDRVEGHERFYVHDPFGNRLELIAPAG
jgi:catechol 2,3-dioxygenase-like lactoylglutathione lyase family enzyme